MRIDPAAAFLGLAKRGSPFSARSWLIFRKDLKGK